MLCQWQDACTAMAAWCCLRIPAQTVNACTGCVAAWCVKLTKVVGEVHGARCPPECVLQAADSLGLELTTEAPRVHPGAWCATYVSLLCLQPVMRWRLTDGPVGDLVIWRVAVGMPLQCAASIIARRQAGCFQLVCCACQYCDATNVSTVLSWDRHNACLSVAAVGSTWLLRQYISVACGCCVLREGQLHSSQHGSRLVYHIVASLACAILHEGVGGTAVHCLIASRPAACSHSL
ncbi:hypothetical protein COO60DRAFT_1478415 [Scenedesmus sp. NREL 46B-D3]|nr:hypothetical protein COO60DRAFT_1478415 [Scenedesmus sp. NREL 46B-D3]